METNGIAELKMNFEFTHPDVAPAWLIGSRTHLLDCWEPQLEWLRMPRLLFDDKEFTACQAFDDKPSRGDVNPDESISFDGLYYDARVHGGSNIAHAILGGAITTLACEFAARKLGLDSVVTTVIPAKTAYYVQEVYKILGIQTLATDSPVLGQKWQYLHNYRFSIPLFFESLNW